MTAAGDNDNIRYEIRKHVYSEEWERVETLPEDYEAVFYLHSQHAGVEKLSIANKSTVFAIFAAIDRYTIAPEKIWFGGKMYSSCIKKKAKAPIVKVGEFYYN